MTRWGGMAGDYLIETPRIIAVTPLTHFLSVGRPLSWQHGLIAAVFAIFLNATLI